jgi:hypothetical protein
LIGHAAHLCIVGPHVGALDHAPGDRARRVADQLELADAVDRQVEHDKLERLAGAEQRTHLEQVAGLSGQFAVGRQEPDGALAEEPEDVALAGGSAGPVDAALQLAQHRLIDVPVLAVAEDVPGDPAAPPHARGGAQPEADRAAGDRGEQVTVRHVGHDQRSVPMSRGWRRGGPCRMRRSIQLLTSMPAKKLAPAAATV